MSRLLEWLRLGGRWLSSSRVRQATELERHVRYLLNWQRDVASPETIREVTSALAELRQRWTGTADAPSIRVAMDKLQLLARQSLRNYSPLAIREFFAMFLVAFVVVLSVRTFFFQPMKIPTGSMQPTLYGINAEDLRHDRNFEVPGAWKRWTDRWIRGLTYYHIVATAPGRLSQIEPPKPIVPFLNLPWLQRQRFLVGQTWYTVWFPPVELPNPYNIRPEYVLFAHAGVNPRHYYRAGEDLIKLRVAAGDHVLVDRLTYNFRRPRRGEIIVFETHGIPFVQQDTYYIKRLVGLGGERIRIGNDRHVVANGQRLDARTPHFENVYSFSEKDKPAENKYSGHVNEDIALANHQPKGVLSPLFAHETDEFLVEPGHLLVLGDNTMNSYDGRRWGDFAQEKVVGRFCLVYWPYSERFGWGQD